MVFLETNKNGNREINPIESWKYGIKTPTIDIEFTNLTYTVSTGKKSEKDILKNISGQFKSNELTAVMGPSGSGKSTLLNILTGFQNDGVSGIVTINGQPRDMRTFRKMSCYVMQDDLFQPKMTVLEAMHFAADLKLGFHVPKSSKQILIIDILKTLRLLHAQNTMTEKLSGGEGKRLSIALELVSNPPVIILDEPTTGLDELSSTQCIDLLRKIALTGKTVVCSIHTPSAKIFSKFHNIYIVASGQCVYRGPSNKLVPFLSTVGIDCPKTYNPADFVIDVSCGEYGHDFVKKMMSTVNTKFPITPIQRTMSYDIEKSYQKNTKVQWHIQFCVLSKRMMIQTIRDWNFVLFKLIMYLLSGLLLGCLYFNLGGDGSKTISIFLFCLACSVFFGYIPMIPIILSHPHQLQLVEREHFNRWYDISPFFWASNLSTIPVAMSAATIIIITAYSLSGLPLEYYRFAMFSSSCILTMFISEGIGFVLGTLFSVVFGSMLILTVQGFGDITPLPIYRSCLMYISHLRYGFEAMVISIFGYDREGLSCPDEYCHYKMPIDILKIGHMESRDFWINLKMLFAFFIAIRMLLYYLLQRRIHNRINPSNNKTKKKTIFRLGNFE
ncbi:ATP-binding cassette sub-family G member 4-like [Aphidius gifuensis]|uniref:ATP-binding cassette sub-family G member 4-like n=1 Tax=Aphidius gifuensis TaxID=684658 RepID=UPI001CDC02D3|nr:ATP-binding cassette sub-family G member 4-like [Aphidius gifuensis]